VVQARATPTAKLREMLDFSGADALCVHLNPAQEVVQAGGDRDFRGGLETIARVVAELDRPVIVKETGCGISRAVAERLVRVGVRHVDVGGSGGTSWVGVEAHRAPAEMRAIGQRFWDWGIPTGASVAQLAGLGVSIVATGGVGDGLAAARALALGATIVGIARPFLRAQDKGIDALREAVEGVIREIRIAMLLAGCADVAALGRAPLVLGPRILRWVPAGSPLRARLLDAAP
jgi:isopentenyl-diphosphate delta-isomerase